MIPNAVCPWVSELIVNHLGADLQMARQRLPHHRAYECFQRKMECSKCNVILNFKTRAVRCPAECRQRLTAKSILRTTKAMIGEAMSRAKCVA